MSTASRRRAANKAASQGMSDIPAAKTSTSPSTSTVTVPTEVIEVEVAAQPVSHIDNVFNKCWLRKTQTAIVKSVKKDGAATKRETYYPQLVLWPSGKLACRASTTLAAIHERLMCLYPNFEYLPCAKEHAEVYNAGGKGESTGPALKGVWAALAMGFSAIARQVSAPASLKTPAGATYSREVKVDKLIGHYLKQTEVDKESGMLPIDEFEKAMGLERRSMDKVKYGKFIDKRYALEFGDNSLAELPEGSMCPPPNDMGFRGGHPCSWSGDSVVQEGLSLFKAGEYSLLDDPKVLAARKEAEAKELAKAKEDEAKELKENLSK